MFKSHHRGTVKAFNLEFEEFRHSETGMRHIHLNLNREQHAFQVQFRTQPTDDSGVAHILEHSVLQGSRRFPVPGIFFKRFPSLLGECNAYTSRQWTRYLFTSSSWTDFRQMLWLYLDACFFPLLSEEIFWQEGHHLELLNPADPKSGLKVVGVVYNEMKGAYSEASQRFSRELQRHTLPDTVFARDSGGDPAKIRELEYEQFRQFHWNNYHPANAISCYCGPRQAEEVMRELEECVIQKSNWNDRPGRNKLQLTGSLNSPQQKQFVYPFQQTQPENAAWTARSWVAGDRSRMDEELRMRFLMESSAFGAATPIYQALLALGKGSPYFTLLDGYSLPVIGAMNVPLSELGDVHNLLQQEFEKLATGALPDSDLRAIADGIELDLRNIEDGAGGELSSFPMQLLDRAVDAVTHHQDLGATLNPIEEFKQLRESLCDPAEFRKDIESRFLKNPRTLRLDMCADSKLAAAEDAAEQTWLQAKARELGPGTLKTLPEIHARIEARRNDASMDHMILRLKPADVAPVFGEYNGQQQKAVSLIEHSYQVPCNGLAYLRLEQDFPWTGFEHLQRMSLLGMIPHLGYAELDFQQAQQYRRELGSDYSVAVNIDNPMDNLDHIKLSLWSSMDLQPGRLEACATMMRDSLAEARIQAPERWQELLSSALSSKKQQLFGTGISQALMKELGSFHNPRVALEARLSGFSSTAYLETLLSDNSSLVTEITLLEDQLRQLQQRKFKALYIADSSAGSILQETFTHDLGATTAAPAEPTVTNVHNRQLWLCNTQVNYSGISIKSIPATHPDFALLRMCAGILTFKYLLPLIREAHGAYSAFANAGSGAFIMQTYRDPRLFGSLQDLKQALNWFMNHQIPDDWVEEAALTQLGRLIASHSSMAGVLGQESEQSRGYTRAMKERDFQTIQRATLTRIRRAVEEHLMPHADDPAEVLVSSESIVKGLDTSAYKVQHG